MSHLNLYFSIVVILMCVENGDLGGQTATKAEQIVSHPKSQIMTKSSRLSMVGMSA